jgi:hypothetical protein
MPLTKKALGDVVLHIYDFPFWGGIYLPSVRRYETDTPCIVAWTDNGEIEAVIHQACLDQGFTNWLNVAVVSDICDEAPEQTGAALIAAFNEGCREGGGLCSMMNYRAANPPQ